MDRRTALKLPLLLAAGTAVATAGRAGAEPGRWPAERANSWYQAQGWLVGANYITSNAVNQLEMFQPGTYDSRRIDGELAAARSLGFNTMRVFLHDQLWAQDRQGFQGRLAQFVAIAARHGIKPLFVLFDSCWDPFPRPGRQRPPRPGCTTPGGCKARVPNTSVIAATSACFTTMSPESWASSAVTTGFWVGTCGTNPTIPHACIARWSAVTNWRWSPTCCPRCSGGRGQSILLSR
ncbi:hypothetical protein BZL30_1114 [Mycobacterium kansasii]|uniref:Cellulase family protein n=1 Tax=Mycobacterium kansasii TaxID=1768 RepID=A0A1V3XXK9_MYCKA|nr:hypothetical protein BZL30_1114 [Mycobacterium kansasii]OOK83954.1 hypothetical protein BZL29_0809 [Mycobacterium kansasii]